MGLEKNGDYVAESGAADFFKVVTHSAVMLRETNQTSQINRSCHDDAVARSAIDGCAQILKLRIGITHGWKRFANPGVSTEEFDQTPLCERSRIDDLAGAISLCCNDPRTIAHLTVSQSRAVFDDQDPLAPHEIGFVSLAFFAVALSQSARYVPCHHSQ
jgi:hypothetical protein